MNRSLAEGNALKSLGLTGVASVLRSASYLITLSARTQHVGRNGQADLLSCLQVNDELKLRRLFHGQVG
jgi:hypothetical protein